MVEELDLGKLSKEELLNLQKDVAAQLKSWEERRFRDAKLQVEEQARKLGYSLSELAGNYSKRKSRTRKRKKRLTRPPKYRHPDDWKLTWNGMGRRPRWLTELIEAGTTLEDLLIN